MASLPYENATSGAKALAVEVGLLSFESAFLPHMLLENGRTVVEHVEASELLPPQKVVQLEDHR